MHNMTHRDTATARTSTWNKTLAICVGALLGVTVLLGIAAATPNQASATSYPIYHLGTTDSITAKKSAKTKLFPRYVCGDYQYERGYSVIYYGNSINPNTKVGTLTTELPTNSPWGYLEATFPSNNEPAGVYTIDSWAEYYSLGGWHESPSLTNHTTMKLYLTTKTGKLVDPVKIKKPKSKAKKTAKISWTMNEYADGYQIQYSTSKKFKKVKNKKIKYSLRTTKTIKKLKSKKKYFVHVRAYKKIEGKVRYSDWSKTKVVKVK